MMTCTADFNVTSFSIPTTAVMGNNHTLRCQYNIPDPSSTGGFVHVDWYKKQSNVHIWRARNFKDNAHTDFNEAQSGYEPELTGSSISFPDFLSKHSTFKCIKLDDTGDYRCCVHIDGQMDDFACSPFLHVDVIGKYIPRMQICSELKKSVNV